MPGRGQAEAAGGDGILYGEFASLRSIDTRDDWAKYDDIFYGQGEFAAADPDVTRDDWSELFAETDPYQSDQAERKGVGAFQDIMQYIDEHAAEQDKAACEFIWRKQPAPEDVPIGALLALCFAEYQYQKGLAVNPLEELEEDFLDRIARIETERHCSITPTAVRRQYELFSEAAAEAEANRT